MRKIISFLALSAACASPASADGPAFVGPAGWSSDTATASADPSQQVAKWHLPGDPVASLTYSRTTRAYADSLGAIHTNISTNNIHPAMDKDLPCQGKTGHVVQFTFGPTDHKVVINRLLLPTTDGSVAITYSYADGTPFDPEVTKAETAYCAGTTP